MAAKGRVMRAVEDELRELASRDAVLAGGALAAVAIQLAREIDSAAAPAAAKASCSRELRQVLGDLRAAQSDAGKDRLDELSARRSARHGRSAAQD